jgi:hypothetical protein
VGKVWRVPVLLVLGAGLFLTPARASESRKSGKKKLEAFIATLEVKEAAEPPDWWNPEEKPLFTFAQISDIHLSTRRVPLLEEALDFLRERVRPAFVLVTGDNAAPGAEKAVDGKVLRGGALLRALFEKRLGAPFFVLRGDNWPEDFHRVFGSTRFRFAAGGVLFVCAGLDVDSRGDGIGVFRPDTFAWIRSEIEGNPMTPVVFVMHENIAPPVFLDADRLGRLLEKSPNVFLTLTGHLHYDLEFRPGRVVHIAAPGFGPHPRHGLKVFHVYPGFIGVRTVERREEGAFAFADKWQRVDFPPALGADSRAPAAPGALRRLPARPTTFDPGLRDRRDELAVPVLRFAVAIGRGKDLLRLLRGGEAEEDEGGKEFPPEDGEDFCPFPSMENPGGEWYNVPGWREGRFRLPGVVR